MNSKPNRVHVHQLAASSRNLLTDPPLPFGSGYRLITSWFSTVIFPQRTFTSLVNAHAGRTQMCNVRTQKRRAGTTSALLQPPHLQALEVL